MVLDDVTFETNSDRLTPASRDILADVVRTLLAAPDDRVLVQAHTDSQGADTYNMGLSIRRAQSVVDFLIAGGVSQERLEFEGLGETRPIADNQTARGRALNRRVEMIWSTEQCQ